MTTTRRKLTHATAPFRFILAVGFLTIFVLLGLRRGAAQSSCEDPETATLASGEVRKWKINAQVCYSISADFDESERSQIMGALGVWNSANQNNGSGVQFQESGCSSSYTLGISIDRSITSQARYDTVLIGSTIQSATIRFNPDFQPPGFVGPAYSPTHNGGDDYVLRVMLHEIGHLMGLEHHLATNVDPCSSSVTPGATIMNPGCNVNDCRDGVESCEVRNTPDFVTPCDNNIIQREVFPEHNQQGSNNCYSPGPSSCQTRYYVVEYFHCSEGICQLRFRDYLGVTYFCS